MQIICISRGSQSQGKEFAKQLSKKLGYESLSREDLLEIATKQRIPIGKLETAMIKPHLFNEQLALELEHYKALSTNILCEKALNGNIVYHGRTGHLLLTGVHHILKIRVESDIEARINIVMNEMNLSREKAKNYIEQIDEDRRRWVRKFYNLDWNIFNLYDVILNLSYMSPVNAATSVCSIAQLPEFQATPATIQTLQDLYLASKAKLLLFADKRTKYLNLKIKANNQNLNVTYPINIANKIDLIDGILSKLDGINKIIYTKAQENILWIQEKFDDIEKTYPKVISLANKWDAAVEIIKFIPCENPEKSDELKQLEETDNIKDDSWRETGIIETENYKSSFEDMEKVCERLITDGKAGGKKLSFGKINELINTIDKETNYKLIILDNIFLTKSEATKKREIQEWSNTLNDILKLPIVTLAELEEKYQFTSKHLIKMILNSIIIAIIIFLIFTFQDSFLSFQRSENITYRIVATIIIAIFVPLFAYIYSIFTSLLLKLLKFE